VFDRRGDYVDESDNRLAVRIHREVATWAKAKYPQVEWGGDWESIVDTPHFQIDTGKSLAEMRDLVKAGKSVI
jgi:peptidoglycan L-alanyl-D-glutamate endopeptidase CwlK